MSIGIGIAIAAIWYFAASIVPHKNLTAEEAKFYAYMAVYDTMIIMGFNVLMFFTTTSDACGREKIKVKQEIYI